MAILWSIQIAGISPLLPRKGPRKLRPFSTWIFCRSICKWSSWCTPTSGFTSCLTLCQSRPKDFLIQLHLKLSSLTFNRESAYILLRESMACRNAENTALHGAVGTAAISELRNQINTSILPSNDVYANNRCSNPTVPCTCRTIRPHGFICNECFMKTAKGQRLVLR